MDSETQPRGGGPQNKTSGPKHTEAQSDYENPHALGFRRSVGNGHLAPGRATMAEKRQRPTQGGILDLHSLAVEDGGFRVNVARVELRCSRFLASLGVRWVSQEYSRRHGGNRRRQAKGEAEPRANSRTSSW